MDLLRTLPLGLYLEQPYTWLHRLDSRVKLAWLLTFLIAPILASTEFRVLLCGLLILITLAAAIPLRVWRQQLGWLLLVMFFAIAITAIAPDGLNIDSQPRLPAYSLPSEPPVLPQPTDYRYILFEIHEGPINLSISRRSLDLGIRISALFFTLVYSTNLYLLTTSPEEITAGIENWLAPLQRFKWPIRELALTLTLSLRFIPLVLEEVQNLVRSVRTRAINWKKLGLRRSAQVWLMVAQRLIENLLLRAEQTANAMYVRGFTTAERHRVEWYQLRLGKADGVAIAILIGFWLSRLIWGNEM